MRNKTLRWTVDVAYRGFVYRAFCLDCLPNGTLVCSSYEGTAARLYVALLCPQAHEERLSHQNAIDCYLFVSIIFTGEPCSPTRLSLAEIPVLADAAIPPPLPVCTRVFC